MFQSLSRTTPQTEVTTSFVTTKTITIIPETPFTILVNGVSPADSNLVVANSGDTVTAIVTTADDYVWHKFYYYSIDGVPSTFAVVNKSLYAIHVKAKDVLLRWYLYTVTTHKLTYRSNTGINTAVQLGARFDDIEEDVHVVLDPNSESVYFYNNYGLQLSKVQLPAAPLAYVKIPDRKTVVVLIFGGECFEIYLNSSKFGTAPLYARRNYSEFIETTFITQAPGEDLIAYLRRARSRKTIPPATCIIYNGTHIWAAGNGSVWKVDPNDNFRLLNVFDIDEYVLNIAPLPDKAGALLVCQSQAVYTIDNNGTLTKIHTGTAVWEPALFNNKLYIPESEVGYLKVYNPLTQEFEDDILLNEFSPSYTCVVDDKLYVCGHDNETVLVFDSMMNQTILSFPAKVTWISVVKDSYIVSHWLKDYKVLDNKDLYRVVSIGFRKRYGPVTHIGTDENLITPLGSDEVYSHTPRDSWLWLNGKRTYSNDLRGTVLTDGDYVAMNFSAKVPGSARTNCVIGDTVYDYDIEAFEETYFPRNINIPVQRPQLQGLYTGTIILPQYFTPSRVSIEFGSIKVNDAYYYGDAVVNANDKIEVEINTRGNNALPVFTIGTRQFVIPISTNVIEINPISYELTELDPGTLSEYQIELTESSSRVDYIIPGYYDIQVTKNDVDITGNYYQQFGKGDILKVQFLSSRKIYDTKNVYILGGITNYEFIAKNKTAKHINYLDFGSLLFPYIRYSNSKPIANVISLNSIDAEYYDHPDFQYITNTLTISGLDTGTTGNITVYGGDSYIIHNGNLITGTNTITVTNGDQLALARTILTYFEVPVTIVQYVPTGDEDSFFDFTVGLWGITNRIIANAKQLDNSPKFNLIESLVCKNKKVSVKISDINYNAHKQYSGQRTVFSTIEEIFNEKQFVFDPCTLVTETSRLYIADKLPTISVLRPSQRIAVSNYEEFDKNQQFVFDPYTLVNETSQAHISDKLNIVNLLRPSQRISFSNYVEFDKNQEFVFDPYIPVNVPGWAHISEKINTIDLLRPSQRISFSNYVEFDKNQEFVFDPYIPVNVPSWAHISDKINTIDVLRPSQRVAFSNVEEFIKEELVKFKSYSPIEHTNDNWLAYIPNTIKLVNSTQRNVFNNVEELNTNTIFNLVAGNTVHGYTTNKTQSIGMHPTILQTDIKNVSNSITLTDSIKNYTLVSLNTSSANTLNFGVADTTTVHLDYIAQYLHAQYSTAIDTNNYASDRCMLENFYINSMKNELVPQAYIAPYEGLVNTLFDIVENVYNSNFTQFELFNTAIWNSVTKPKKITRNYYRTGQQFEKLVRIYYRTGQPFEKEVRIYYPIRRLIEKLVRIYYRTGQQFEKEVRIYYPIRQPIEKAVRIYYPIRQPIEKEVRIYYPNRQPIEKVLPEYYFTNQPIEKVLPEYYFTNQLYLKEILNEYFSTTTSAHEKSDYILPQYWEFNTIDLHYVNTKNSLPNVSANYRLHYVTSKVKKDLTDTLENPLDNIIKINYVQSKSIDNLQSIVMNYIQASATNYLSLTTPTREIITLLAHESNYVYTKEIYPMLALTNSAVEQNQQSQSNYSKYSWSRNRPEYYSAAAITTVEFNQGELWDHDIETDYGAFVTINDAFEAAKKYQAFSPYLIFDTIGTTNLWTYRVLLDTNLVCPFPKGRYPVAWLMRGG